MNSLHNVQLWELMRSHQAELLKEAQNEHLARKVQEPQAGWWRNLLRRPAQVAAPALQTSATPELS